VHKPYKSKLPVKIWIYGGSDEAGGISNAMYTGCYAAENVIQVNINYRQGPLGFLAVEKAGINGNFGIQDQLLALKWIKANIESFGGDPVRLFPTPAVLFLPATNGAFSMESRTGWFSSDSQLAPPTPLLLRLWTRRLI
jgi:hypothetical protein